jgi:hypothetical protein
MFFFLFCYSSSAFPLIFFTLVYFPPLQLPKTLLEDTFSPFRDYYCRRMISGSTFVLWVVLLFGLFLLVEFSFRGTPPQSFSLSVDTQFFPFFSVLLLLPIVIIGHTLWKAGFETFNRTASKVPRSPFSFPYPIYAPLYR